MTVAHDGPVAFVGDSHLLAGDAVTLDLVRFIDACVARYARIVLVGDIFDLWIARPHLHEDHHVRVLAALAQARDRGLAVDYTVGNRDFGVESLAGAPFDRIATEVLAAPDTTSPGWAAEHGDLVNQDDLQYRRWRALSRSGPVLGTYLRLPGALGIPLSRWLERRMATTNLAYKRSFPMEHALRRAAGHAQRLGIRHLVLGHFHQELAFDAAGCAVHVLPDWKRSRRHAVWTPGPSGGTVEFVDSLP